MAYSDAILAESALVAYWRLEETSGTSAADSEGTYTGTHSNVTVNEAGFNGGKCAKYVRASGSYTQVADNSALEGLSGLTLEAWVNLNSAPGTDELYTIIGKQGSYYLVYRDEGGTKKFQISGNGVDSPVKINYTLTPGSWYHVALTWETGTNNLKLYVNGSEVGNGTHSSAMGTSSNALEIGRFAGTHVMNGWIDEVALYNVALSSSAVAAHYNAGTTASKSATDSATATDTAAGVTSYVGGGSYEAAVDAEASLAAWWRLNETSGAVAADSKGTDHGTFYNTPTLGGTGIPGALTGRSTAFAAASSEYVEAPDNSALKGKSALTIETWVKFASLPTSGNLYALVGKNSSWYLTLRNNGGTYELYANLNWESPGNRSVNWTPSTGQWYHVVATWSQSSGVLKFYVNGVQQGASRSNPAAAGAGAATTVEIGRFVAASYLDGTLAEVAVYTAELSSASVLAHYNAGVGAPLSDSITATEGATAGEPTDPVSASDSAGATDTGDPVAVQIGGPRSGTVKVLTVGDSNTSGGYSGIAWSVWPDRVQSALASALPTQTITLTNNAIGGTTSYDLLTAYATAIGDEQPSVMVLMHGTNDAWYDDPLGGYPRGDGADYSAAAFQTRIATLVDNALGLTDAYGHRTKVVLCTPPPAAVQADGTTLWRDSVRLSAMRDAVRAVAVEKGVRYVDPWGAIQAADPTGWKATYLNDGVHLKSAGQQFVADLVTAAVLAELSAPVGDFAAASEASSVSTLIGLVTLNASDAAAITEAAAAYAPSPVAASDTADASDAAVSTVTYTVASDSALATEGAPAVGITIPPTSDWTLTALPPGATVTLFRVGEWRGSLLVKRHAGQAPATQTVVVDDYGEATFSGLLAGEYVATCDAPWRRVFFQTGVL